MRRWNQARQTPRRTRNDWRNSIRGRCSQVSSTDRSQPRCRRRSSCWPISCRPISAPGVRRRRRQAAHAPDERGRKRDVPPHDGGCGRHARAQRKERSRREQPQGQPARKLRERGSSLAVARTVRLNPANDLGRFVAQSKSVSGGLQTGFRVNPFRRIAWMLPNCVRHDGPGGGRSFFDRAAGTVFNTFPFERAAGSPASISRRRGVRDPRRGSDDCRWRHAGSAARCTPCHRNLPRFRPRPTESRVSSARAPVPPRPCRPESTRTMVSIDSARPYRAACTG